MRILVTGTAGFIGFHLAQRLLDDGHVVVGFDGMTNYYDVRLKHARHALLKQRYGFTEAIGMLEDAEALQRAADIAKPDVIVHLAAQAGVRYSLEHPEAYVSSNVNGSFNVLELARATAPQHLLLASTSSIYGANEKVPFAEMDRADEPLTIYAATKKAMEVMAHSYAHLHKIPTTAFRFFTVYGPWGRPDMALFKFVDAVKKGMPIDIYGYGNMRRDFTYIDDIVEGIALLMHVVPSESNRVEAHSVKDTLSYQGPFRVVNIGGGNPIELLEFVKIIEDELRKKAISNLLPMQKGDVPQTNAENGLIEALTGFKPRVSIHSGVKSFIEWYEGVLPQIYSPQ